MAGNLILTMDAGFSYDLALPTPDEVPVGAHWEGGALRAGQAPQGASRLLQRGPLHLMYQPRLILKVDDLSDHSLRGFQRIARMVDRFNTKATFGINPGRANAELWAFVNSLDRNRFEIWNHTWDHGRSGPNQWGQPYDVQWANIERAQEAVKRETGIVMRTFGEAGIRVGGRSVGDQDEVTYYVVRNHPDLNGMFGPPGRFADRGPGTINSEGIFISSALGVFENEGFPPDQRKPGGTPEESFVERWRQRYPDEDPHRPFPVGNSDELIWRLEHPLRAVPPGGITDSAHAQMHPYAWTDDAIIDSMGRMLAHAEGHGWRVSTAEETYRWLRDRDLIVVEKTAPDRYRLDARHLRHSHRVELAVPDTTRVEKHAYQIAHDR